MLVARNQTEGDEVTDMDCFICFSNDGENWTDRRTLANTGPCYPSIAEFESGKVLLMYSKEAAHTAHIYIPE